MDACITLMWRTFVPVAQATKIPQRSCSTSACRVYAALTAAAQQLHKRDWLLLIIYLKEKRPTGGVGGGRALLGLDRKLRMVLMILSRLFGVLNCRLSCGFGVRGVRHNLFKNLLV